LFVLVVIGGSIATSIQPYFYKLFIDAIPANNFQLLLKILSVYIAVRILELACDNLTYFIGDSVVFPASRDARLSVFS
jgi:hypothetical protein